MEDVEVCRICLVVNVKMYQVHSFPINTYLEQIIGDTHLNTLDLPPYVCYECAMLLKKCYNFREKCVLGQSVLYGILQSSGKISIEDIKIIDRKQLKLTSNLQHSLPSNTIFITHNEGKQPIKKEFDEIKLKDEETINGDRPQDIIEFLKYEIPNEEGLLDGDTGMAMSSDDEPLLLHKLNKEKKQKTGKKRGRRKNEIAEVDFGDLVEFEVLKEELPQKKKRGRPKKIVAEGAEKEKVVRSRRTKNTGGVAEDDMDLEEFCTVVKLSIEEQIQEVQSRHQSSNYTNAPYKCSLCFKGFIDDAAWSHHRSKHDPSAGPVECTICKFRFKTRRALQKHAANHEKKFACKACPYVSKTSAQAKQHQRWHKGVTYKCQYCDEVSTKWTSYLSHVRIKHPSEFICGVCGYSFVSKLGLTMHRSMMHKDEKTENNDTGPYCADCDVKFTSEEAYKRHMVTSAKHTQSKDFNTGCKVCGETFKSNEELRLHHRKEHARKRPKNYGKKPSAVTWPTGCQHCGTLIPNARELWAHYRRAHPGVPYPIRKDHVCDVCGKSFRGNAFLVYHKRTHSTERAYKCPVCPKAFFNPTNLQMHEKTHSDRRPYPCAVCCKAFKCKGALDRHFRSHTGEKPYKCEVCGKAFGQSNSRKLHMRTVHLRLPAPYVSRSRAEKRKATLQTNIDTSVSYVLPY